MLQEGRQAIAEMKRLDASIADPGVSADIVRLSQVSEKIFQAVKDDPGKLPQIRKFMDYYLPTTLKLLNAYDRMGQTGIEGENIAGTRSRIDAVMETLVSAYDRQLDALFADEALDVATDITVMENLLRQEGLSEEKPFSANG